MKTPGVIFIVIALVGAAMLSFAAYAWMKKTPVLPPIVEKETIQQIVVASSSIGLGTRVGEENVRLVSWVEKNRPAGYFGSIDQVKGRVLLQNVVENEPIIESKLSPDKTKTAGLVPIIKEGRRAFSIRVTDVINVAGFAIPGTMVDVLVTGNPSHAGGGSNRGPQTKTILQNIPVLTAGQHVERNPDGKPIANVTVVTLEVTPEEAERLSLASLEGKIQLALRNPLDQKTEQTPGAEFVGLFTGVKSAPVSAKASRGPAPKPKAKPAAAPAEPAPTPKPVPAMEVFSGGKRAVYTF